MKKLTALIKKYDDNFMRLWNEYLELNKQFDALRGKTDPDAWKEADRLLVLMQDKFRLEFGPMAHYIIQRNQFCINATNSFQAFIDELKKMGAKEVPIDSQVH
jgi:hypothetical protein